MDYEPKDREESVDETQPLPVETEEQTEPTLDQEMGPVEEPQKKEYQDPNEGAVYTYGSGQQTNPHQPQHPYQPYQPSQPAQEEKGVVSLGEWLLVIFVGAIPCIGFILYLVWAFGNTGNLNVRNYCRASLIIQIAGSVVALLFAVVFMALGVVF